jgi:hypothetical protein
MTNDGNNDEARIAFRHWLIQASFDIRHSDFVIKILRDTLSM